jgi:phage tail sheath protein FI
VYDKYNDVNRWIPCASGTAGLVARVARLQNPWISPAGYTNGIYKNYLKLAWSPNKAQRDELFKRGVNPVIASPSDGFVLLGDKTALNRKSAFDQIHVRTLFLYIERAITVMAKAYLFSVNDVYTRASFTAAIEPFLRLIKGARGMEDFKVIVNESNNGPAVREQNLLNGLCLIRPNYSVRFINLTFSAVKPTVSFEEIEQAEGL